MNYKFGLMASSADCYGVHAWFIKSLSKMFYVKTLIARFSKSEIQMPLETFAILHRK